MFKLPAYADVQEVMERAVEADTGLRYRLPSYGSAVNFRQRCYRFRSMQQQMLYKQVGNVPGAMLTTPYDDLELLITDTKGKRINRKTHTSNPAAPHDVVIRHRTPSGEILPLDDLDVD